MATGSLAHSPLYRVLVRVSESCFGIEKKLQKYFQNPSRSGGGKCNVTPGSLEGTFWVEFYKRQAREGVIAKKDHSLVISDASHVNIYIETNEYPDENSLEISQLSSQTQALADESPDEKHREEGGAASSSDSMKQKVFIHSRARLNFKLSKEEREKILNLCPNIKVEEDNDGPEKVMGNFEDIKKVYKFLSEKTMKNNSVPHSASAREIEGAMPKKSDNPVPDANPAEVESELISVPSHLYYYFKHFFAETVDRIENEYQVHIKNTVSHPTGIVYLNFETNKLWDRRAAEEAFAREFQREVKNVTHKEFLFTDNKLVREVQKILTDMFKGLQIKAEGKVLIICGKPQGMLGAQHFIETTFCRKKPLERIRLPKSRKNEIEVDTVYMRFLHQEFKDIETTYDTVMELVNKSYMRRTHVIFRPKRKDIDLSSQAYEDFVEVFQMLLAEIVKEVVILKPGSQERKSLPEKTFFEEFERKHPCVNLEWYEQELALIGLPKYVTKAMKYVKKYFSIEGPAQQRQVLDLSLGEIWYRDPKSPLAQSAAEFKKTFSSFNEFSGCYGDFGRMNEAEEEEECAICLDVIREKQNLSKCRHVFCAPCINEAMKHKPVCPVCQTSYYAETGVQPEGTMATSYKPTSLPGYTCGTIVIQYDMKGGIQSKGHPHPGRPYEGTVQVAYLPNNVEGRQVMNLLRRAFEKRLIFTVGRSGPSDSDDDVITWNNIQHKTLQSGGPDDYGYPDPTYLQRVKEELKAKGIE